MYKRYIFALLIALITISCSTKKNTWLSRNYQKLTSHYNTFYNATEAFDKGIDKVRKAYANDYSHVLPIYEFGTAQAAKPATGDMETTLKKCHKVIQLHSITVKPARKENMTEKDKRFAAKEEFNPYVGEAYLLMGKANVVKHEETEAIEIFEYIARKHSGERISYESKIWKAIAYTQLEQYANAQSALESYDLDGMAPLELYPQYMAAAANVYITKGEYAKAIPHMEAAVAETTDKHLLRRYKYILAQLYRECGKRDKAAPLFLSLSKTITDFDMAFAAKLDLATVATTPAELAAAEKKLNKMARDAKHAEQLDQIHYSLGKLEEGRGDTAKAIGNYRTSIAASTTNANQKGLSFMALADIYHAVPQYIEASEALDSAATYLSDANQRKAEATSKAALLHPLADELRTIATTDSLLRLAQMPEKERNKIIDDIIKEQRRQQRAAEEAQLAMQEAAMNQSDFHNITSPSGMGGAQSRQWYFYNPTAVNAGKSTFVGKWGQRKNEDNWRRSNKSSTTISVAEMEDMFANGEPIEQQAATGAPAGAPATPDSRESLLANLPLTPEAQQAANTRIDNALFASGCMLYDDIRDYPSAIKQMQTLVSRYPQSDNRYNALVIMHFAQLKSNQRLQAANTAEQIQREYPASTYASYLSLPDYFGQRNATEQQLEQRYAVAYRSYLSGNYTEAIAIATQALSEPADTARSAHYLLVRSLSYAKQAMAEPFRTDLMRITTSHAGTPQDSVAQLLLAQLDNGQQPIRATQYESPLANAGRDISSAPQRRDTYTFRPDTAHAVVCVVDNNKQNAAQFEVANYNFSNFIVADYDLKISQLSDKRPIIIVSGFANGEDAINYFYQLREQPFWKELTSASVPQILPISANNIRLLTLTADIDAYEEFFRNNYMRKP